MAGSTHQRLEMTQGLQPERNNFFDATTGLELRSWAKVGFRPRRGLPMKIMKATAVSEC